MRGKNNVIGKEDSKAWFVNSDDERNRVKRLDTEGDKKFNRKMDNNLCRLSEALLKKKIKYKMNVGD